VEETFAQNGNKSVVIVAHSMGAPMTYTMLQKQTQAWKDKYIKALVSLSGAWAGSVKALKVYVVGKQYLMEIQSIHRKVLSLCDDVVPFLVSRTWGYVWGALYSNFLRIIP